MRKRPDSPALSERERRIYDIYRKRKPARLELSEHDLAPYLGDAFIEFIQDDERGLDSVLELLYTLNAGYLARKSKRAKRQLSVRALPSVWNALSRAERARRIEAFAEKGSVENPFGVPVFGNAPDETAQVFTVSVKREAAKRLSDLSMTSGVPMSRLINLALRINPDESF